MSEKNPFILFITGTSASGKTTLYESLRTDTELSDIEFHDIDENGVPPVGRGAWRAYRVEQLYFDAVNTSRSEGKSTVICGISFPHEVIESTYYTTDHNVHFLLTEAAEQQVRERLIVRSEVQAEKGTWDESFSGARIEKTIADNLEMRTLLSNSIANQRNGHKIEAQNISKEEMHDQAKAIIQTIQKG